MIRKIEKCLFFQKKVVPLHTIDPGTLPIRTVQHAGPFFYIMIYTKQAIPLAQQIQTLKQRGLIISDEAAAERFLGSIGYFRLAQYWRVFEADKVNHVFKPNSTFEKVLSLYYFDKELKVLVFSALQTIEVTMRAKVIYHFSTKHGPFWFMDENLADKKSSFDENLLSLQSEVERSHEDFIQEHFVKYDVPSLPPAWKTLEVASFGTLSKLFRNFNDPEVKKMVADDFGIPGYKFLRSWMKCLTVVRNSCAHHARIWNRRFSFAPMLPTKRMPSAWITQQPTATKSLYPHLCCMVYWLNSIKSDNTFVADFKNLLAKYPNVDPFAMGFPRGWQNEALWQ